MVVKEKSLACNCKACPTCFRTFDLCIKRGEVYNLDKTLKQELKKGCFDKLIKNHFTK